MRQLDDLVDFDRLLAEAGWQPHYQTGISREVKPKYDENGEPVFPTSPARGRNETPGVGESGRLKSGIPIERWWKMTPVARKAAAFKYQKARQRMGTDKSKLAAAMAGRNPASTAAAEPVARNKRETIDPTSVVAPRGWDDRSWWVVDEAGEPYPDTHPYATEPEAKEAAKAIAHRAAEAAGVAIKTRTNEETGETVRSGVKKYLQFVKSLGVHHTNRGISVTNVKQMPKTTSEPLDNPLDRSGYIVVGQDGQYRKGPYQDQETAQKIADKLGSGNTIKPNKVAEPGRSIESARGGGAAKVLTSNKSDSTGFYVIYDENPEARLDGPFQDEREARAAADRFAKEETQQQIKEQGLQGHEADRLYKKLKDEVSFTFFDAKEDAERKKKEQARVGAGGLDKGSSNDRRWEYGDMRAHQIEMFEKGECTPADKNPDPNYLAKFDKMGAMQKLAHLKNVFCPLILDKCDPPRKPWSINQVMEAMMPIVDNLLSSKKWGGDGFDASMGIGPALTGMMNALINDRGKSPFPGYAERNYIVPKIRIAKKTGGAVGRAQASDGWMNSGVTSLATPTGIDGQGELGDNLAQDTATFEKVKCPSCKGVGFDPDDEGETCTNCHGSGTFGSDKKGQPKKCPLCKGHKNEQGTAVIKHPCPTCSGTGSLIPYAEREVEKDIQGGFRINPKTGEMERRDVVVNDQSSDGANTDNDQIVIRLNSAARLIERLMQEADVTPTQRQILALAFGLDGSLKAKGPTEVAALLGIIRNLPKPMAKQGIEVAIRNSLRKMRNVISSTKDEQLFDWFLEYQFPDDPIGLTGKQTLKDLADTDGLPDWGEEEKPWGTSTGGKLKSKEAIDDETAEAIAAEKKNPWYKRPLEELTPNEHREAIKSMLDLKLMSQADLTDWLERNISPEDKEKGKGPPTLETLPADKLVSLHRMLRKELNSSVRPSREGPDATGYESYWMDKEGKPTETSSEKAKRWDAAKAAAYTRKAAAWVAKGNSGKVPPLSDEELKALQASFESPTGTSESAAANAAKKAARQQGEPSIPPRQEVDEPEEPVAPKTVKTMSPSERKRRYEEKMAARKAEIPATVEEGRSRINRLIDLMEDLYFNMIAEEVGQGKYGEEVLELLV